MQSECGKLLENMKKLKGTRNMDFKDEFKNEEM